MNITLKTETETGKSFGKQLSEEIKSFFTNGDYQVSVKFERGSKEDLKLACREASELLYQEEWNVEIEVICENLDNTFEVKIVDLNEC